MALETDVHRRVRAALQPPAIRLRSIQLRHAARTSFGLLLVLAATSFLPQGDPLVSTALLTTFGILQASRRDTLAKARARIIGLFAGSALSVVIILFVPAVYILVPAMVALVVGLWYMTARPALAYAFMVIVTVGCNTSLRHLDPVHTLVEYGVLILLSGVVGTLVGFAVVPRLRPRPLRARIVAARTATVVALQTMANEGAFADPETISLHRAAAQSRAQLTPDQERLTEEQLAELDRFRTALGDFAVLGAATGLIRDAGPETLKGALAAATDPGVPAEADGGERSTSTTRLLGPMVTGLAAEVREMEEHLLASLPLPTSNEQRASLSVHSDGTPRVFGSARETAERRTFSREVDCSSG